ncbi:MAG TPA: hypothetical protein VHM90_18545, partial [Phycisphaerae bacterium]|nr:hypothetical protein [Phycisphaerae bacterium]
MKRRFQLATLLTTLTLAASVGGCQRSLFMGSDTYTQSVVDRYWDGDSARQTTQSRERSSEMGFG